METKLYKHINYMFVKLGDDNNKRFIRHRSSFIYNLIFNKRRSDGNEITR